jgi:hypothetical protein
MSIFDRIRGRATHGGRDGWTRQKRTKEWAATRQRPRGKPVRLADLDLEPKSEDDGGLKS